MAGYGVSGIIFDSSGRVLLVREVAGAAEHYVPPGGTVERGETPRQAAGREILEEAGVQARVGPLIGAYVSRADGWLALGFLAEIAAGEPRVVDPAEIRDVGWFDPSRLPSPCPTLASALIADAVAGLRGMYREL